MGEEKLCHICGTKMKDKDLVCKKCKADPSERIISDCRAGHYAGLSGAYLNLVLTDRRLLAFEDVKGALRAGASAGVIGGLLGGVGGAIGAALATGATGLLQDQMGKAISERPVAKGVNGSLKFETPLKAVTGIRKESSKYGELTVIESPNEKKPLRLIFGTSFDNAVTGDMFMHALNSLLYAR